MKSFCIKTNNNAILDYLLTEIQKLSIDGVYASKNTFKYYKNVIVHYTGYSTELFISELADILAECIIKYYERGIVKRVISCDFSYFNDNEKAAIFSNCAELLNANDTDELALRKGKIKKCVSEYIDENKFFILDGFVNFRLFEYNSLLEECVDLAVNKFIVDREYREFISLLKTFVNSQNCKTRMVHIIYSVADPILLDENQEILNYNIELQQPRYLSDISFSANDYCLNSLLNLLPKNIIIHLLTSEDEFIETLKLIFGDRIKICTDCNICKTFELVNEQKKNPLLSK